MNRVLGTLSQSILGCALALGLFAALDGAAASSSETVLHFFTGSQGDGAYPFAGLTMDGAGSLYGTTLSAGTGGCSDYGGGCGTIFKLAPSGESILYSFQGGKDGAHPYAGLLLGGGGNLYGTTSSGGTGSGTVFRLAPQSVETVLYSFRGGTDGAYPNAGLIMDGSGNLYGTTAFGGSGIDCGTSGCGTIFKLAPNGTETVLYSFCSQANCPDGEDPNGVTSDSLGNLYGTTNSGGAGGAGTIFKLAPNGVETTLYSFCSRANCSDGSGPQAGVIVDTHGNLYGTTNEGGANGAGTAFMLAPNGTETVLYSFCSQANCADGAFPVAGLTEDGQGNLYGTTLQGGASPGCTADAGCGAVFSISPTGTEQVLLSFTGVTDGEFPSAGLIADSKGNLYGTTVYGGGLAGTAFKLGAPATPTTTTLTSSPDPSTAGQAVTFSATVSVSTGPAPNGGTVSFKQGNTILGTATLRRGSARITTSSLPAGVRPVTAVYGGNFVLSFAPSSSKAVLQVVHKLATSTALTSSRNPSKSGQAVTFTATVTSSAGAPPDGETVAFSKGYTTLGTGTLSGGSATFTTSSLPVGTVTITAAYRGDATLANSRSNGVKQVVGP